MRSSPFRVPLLVFTLLSGLAPGAGFAQPDCSAQVRPAATLLVPYFEVDLDNPGGRTTLFAVGNGGAPAVLARVTLWTDWGKPTLAFDLDIPSAAVQTINLRDVFAGTLPTTGGDALPGCTNPLAKPPLGEAERATLRARHTGQPDPTDGQCYGSGRGGAALATGFVTIDAMNFCPVGSARPNSNGYFASGGGGMASNANVLYGDFFLVDPSNDFAQGNAAVHLTADPSRYTQRTFYGDLGFGLTDARAPLGTVHRTRFLAGGVFSGGTQLLVFALPSSNPTIGGGVTCGQRTASVDPCQVLRFTMRPESGLPETAVDRQPVTELAARYTLASTGPADVQTPAAFGAVDIENFTAGDCLITPDGGIALGSWVMPVDSAEGRYSVGLDSIRLEPGCS